MEAEKRSSKGGFFQLFDWNVKSKKKLFSNKSALPGTCLIHINICFFFLGLVILFSRLNFNLILVSFYILMTCWVQNVQTKEKKILAVRRHHGFSRWVSFSRSFIFTLLSFLLNVEHMLKMSYLVVNLDEYARDRT